MRRYIPVFAPDYGDDERNAAIEHFKNDPMITAERHINQFEEQFAQYHGRRSALMVNSGSSAMLVSVSAMEWPKETKVITPAVTFATTVAPLIQKGIEPVFVDVELGTYNIDLGKLIDTLKIVKAEAAIIPHTLGNPIYPGIWKFFKQTIEDTCDALDSKIDGKICGSFGDMSVFSFYPAHHITTGQGGMVLTDDEDLARKAFQYASWGRGCWCRSGQDNLCKSRFSRIVDGVPYDHKYIFEKAGYNLIPMDVAGVIGKVQLKKTEKYKEIRTRNFKIIDNILSDIDNLIIRPKSLKNAEPNWFAYPITLVKGFDRKEITKRIERQGIATRLIFGGNITRQPMFKGISINAPLGLHESDNVMANSFVIGCNHTITEEEANYIAKVVKEEICK